jgi:superfamily II DNA or RNA helicase
MVGKRWSVAKKRMIPKFDNEELFSTQKDARSNEIVGITYGGLFDRAYNQAVKLGATVKVINNQKTLLDIAQPNWDKLQDLPKLREGQDKTLAAIISAYRGHVVEPTGNGKTFVITSLCYIYDTINILVVAPNKPTFLEMIERIQKMCPGERINQLGGGKKKVHPDARIAVCINSSAHHIPSDWPHLVLYDEAHTVGARQIFAKIREFTSSILIGLTASPKGRSDKSDLITEAMFGDVIRRVSYQEAVALGNIANIQVRMVHCDMDDIELRKDIDKERFGYWLNHSRNALLIKAALDTFDPHESVLFMVNRFEHGLAMRRFLPDIPIAHGPVTQTRWEDMGKLGLTANLTLDQVNAVNQEQLKKDFISGKIRWCVSTYCWKQGIDTINLAGLVRMDGANNDILSIQIPGRLSRKGFDGQKQWGVLIDSYDDYGSGYMKRSTNRVKKYNEMGWPIVDI